MHEDYQKIKIDLLPFKIRYEMVVPSMLLIIAMLVEVKLLFTRFVEVNEH